MEFEPKLRPYKVVPLWTLPDKHGEPYNLARQRDRAHFVVLVCGVDVDPAPFLRQLAPTMVELRGLPARGIVVVPSADVAGRLPTLPYTIVIDADGKVRDRYLPEGAAAGLFVLDRYAELYQQWLVRNVAELPAAEDVAGWMLAIGRQC